MFKNPLKLLNWSVFFQTQIFMLPIMLLFYQSNGLTKGDFFLFQGIFSIAALCFEVSSMFIFLPQAANIHPTALKILFVCIKISGFQYRKPLFYQ